jgi:hypothetical protein
LHLRAGKQHVLEHDPLDSVLFDELADQCVQARIPEIKCALFSLPPLQIQFLFGGEVGGPGLQYLLTFKQSPSCVCADVYTQRHKSLRM